MSVNIFEVNLSTRDRISKAKIDLHKRTPFFAYLIEHMTYIESKKVPTMGVNGKAHCLYNPEFVDNLPAIELEAVLVHEVLHIALKHPFRGKDRTIMVNDIPLWNIAIDISVNNMLVENSFSIPSIGIIPQNNDVTVFGITIKDIPSKSSEEIYEELKAQIKKTAKQQSKGSGKGSGKGDKNNIKVSGFDEQEGKGFDEHKWKDDEEETGKNDKNVKSKDGKDGKGKVEDKVKNKDWNKILSEAYNHAKLIGKAPSGFEREIEDLHKHKLNWRSILRKTVASKIPYDLTYKRPNKKYIWGDIYQPSFTGEQISVICSIDTSGSMSQKDLADIISELIGISKSFSQVEFRLLTHDVDVHDDIPITFSHAQKLRSLKVHGGGGTSHIPLYEHIKNKGYKRSTKLLLSFTDGYSDFPDKRPDINTTFILTGGHCPKENMPKWGDTICLE